MRNNLGRLAVLAVLIVGAVMATIRLMPDRPATGDDDYDYAAAFESLDPASGAPLFRITDIAGRSEAELVAVLGPAFDCQSSLYSRRCRFETGATEVLFIAGKADWLTVQAPGATSFDAAVLGRIGLEPRKPDQATAGELVWTDIAGLREVRAIGDGNGLQFLRIKVKS